jgi:hypothetical protein
VNATQARTFYVEQLAFYARKDMEGLVEAHYAADAQLITFDRVCRGKDEIKALFCGYLERLGYLEADLLKFQSTDDTLCFEATVRSAIGTWQAYDCMVLRDNVIVYHFAGVTSDPPATNRVNEQ